MIIDLVIGIIGLIIGLKLGFGLDSVLIFLSVFALDVDILINEFFRIFIKKEKKFDIHNFLDEHSYTHKYILHLPLLIIPIVFITGLLYLNFYFALLSSFMVLCHLFHDTVDNNFDGVSWFYPFNSLSYKLRHGHWEKKSRSDLKVEVKKLAKISRSSGKILKDNAF